MRSIGATPAASTAHAFAPIVEFFGISCVAHLRCFFGTANGLTRSVGACAARLSPTDRGRMLREQSDALRGGCAPQRRPDGDRWPPDVRGSPTASSGGGCAAPLTADDDLRAVQAHLRHSDI
jgi:hypothetical protein